jgi:putative transposase
VRYAFIKEHRGHWAVSLMAKVLAVSVSGFYHWLKRTPCRRKLEEECLTQKIVMFHSSSRAIYGSPRIYEDLQAAGYKVGRKRVARLMKAAGLRGKTKRRFKTTTSSRHARPRAANLVEQNFAVATPNTLWASDITYLPTAEGWLYLAVTLDLFSRKVVGWAFSDRLTDDLTLAALTMATRQRSDLTTLTHHSDQGSQYASHAFRAELDACRITQSMSGRGNCYDNAVVESFFATLKTEEVQDANYQTRQQARTSLFSYLEGFYNSRRRHSSLGLLSPNDFERLHLAQAA